MSALEKLSQGPVHGKTVEVLEKFLCQVYLPNTTIVDIGELRWHFFTKKQLTNEMLPPTKAALLAAIKRANYQALIWGSCNEQKPNVLSPLEYGWEIENDR